MEIVAARADEMLMVPTANTASNFLSHVIRRSKRNSVLKSDSAPWSVWVTGYEIAIGRKARRGATL